MRPVEIDLWKARDVARLLSLVEADRRYFQELLAAIPVPIAIVNRDLTVSACNHAFWGLFEGGQGDSRTDVGQWLEIADVRQKITSVLASGKPGEHEIESSGRSFLLSLQPIRHWDEDVVCLSARPAPKEPEPLAVAAPVLPEPAPAPPEPEPATAPAPEAAPEWAAATWIADAVTFEIESISRGTVPVSADEWDTGGNLLTRNIAPEDIAWVRGFLEGVSAGQPVSTCDYTAMQSGGQPILLRDIARLHEGRIHGITIDIGAAHTAAEQRAQAHRIDSLSRMASRMVHDSNNLIMIMSGYGEDLLHALPPESSLRVNVREILAAGDRLAAATKVLTQFTKRVPVTLKPVDLDRLLDEVRLLGRVLPHGVTLTTVSNAPGVAAIADGSQLLQAVETLIHRAASGLPNGGTITVETSFRTAVHVEAAFPGPVSRACIEVRDSGLAIHPGVLSRLFEPDASSDPLRQKLPVAYQSVRDMSGDIETSANFPSGTSFRILLGVANGVKRTESAPEPKPRIRVKEVPDSDTPSQPRIFEPQPVHLQPPPVNPVGPSVITPELLLRPAVEPPAPVQPVTPVPPPVLAELPKLAEPPKPAEPVKPAAPPVVAEAPKPAEPVIPAATPVVAEAPKPAEPVIPAAPPVVAEPPKPTEPVIPAATPVVAEPPKPAEPVIPAAPPVVAEPPKPPEPVKPPAPPIIAERPVEPVRPVQPIEPQQAPRTEPATMEKTTILVVDDEAGIRSLLRKVLLREGYNVLEATQGREGLEVSKSFKGKIDLLLTDVVMPEMNGIELAQQLHALRPSTRILLISGYMGANALEAEKLPTGTAFLQKPFTLNALLAKVKEVLGATSRPAFS